MEFDDSYDDEELRERLKRSARVRYFDRLLTEEEVIRNQEQGRMLFLASLAGEDRRGILFVGSHSDALVDPRSRQMLDFEIDPKQAEAFLYSPGNNQITGGYLEFKGLRLSEVRMYYAIETLEADKQKILRVLELLKTKLPSESVDDETRIRVDGMVAGRRVIIEKRVGELKGELSKQ